MRHSSPLRMIRRKFRRIRVGNHFEHFRSTSRNSESDRQAPIVVCIVASMMDVISSLPGMSSERKSKHWCNRNRPQISGSMVVWGAASKRMLKISGAFCMRWCFQRPTFWPLSLIYHLQGCRELFVTSTARWSGEDSYLVWRTPKSGSSSADESHIPYRDPSSSRPDDRECIDPG